MNGKEKGTEGSNGRVVEARGLLDQFELTPSGTQTYSMQGCKKPPRLESNVSVLRQGVGCKTRTMRIC